MKKPKPAMPDVWIEDKRPHRFGWAPGGYFFTCRGCKHNGSKDRIVIGDKRATMCADCAYALPDLPPKVLPEEPKVDSTRDEFLRHMLIFIDTIGDAYIRSNMNDALTRYAKGEPRRAVTGAVKSP